MVTEAQLAPLLNAVPSFESEWHSTREGMREDLIAPEFFGALAVHLADRAATGDFSEFEWLFAAIERLYLAGDAELDTALTVGFLEDLIHAAAGRKVSLNQIASYVTGVESKRGWQAAYEYTRPTRMQP
jgi:hypothetical protein